MKASALLPLLLLSITFTACKTQESIRREREVEIISKELQATKSTTQSQREKFDTVEQQLSNLTNQLEESQYAKQQLQEENKNLAQRLNLLEEGHKKQVDYLKALTEKVNNQSNYIEEVLLQLKQISSQAEAAKKKAAEQEKQQLAAAAKEKAKANIPSTFKNGYDAYNKKDFTLAKRIFNDVIKNPKAARYNRDGSLHYLGMIEYNAKSYKNAQVHFSKLYSENQDSQFAKATLYHLGKTFQSLKQTEEANMTFEELISRFPESSEAKDAKNLIKK